MISGVTSDSDGLTTIILDAARRDFLQFRIVIFTRVVRIITMTLSRRTAEDLLPLRPVVFHVLLSLADGDRHGYAIVQDIGQRSAARLQLEPGNLYRTLKFMLDEGLIEESERRPVPG